MMIKIYQRSKHYEFDRRMDGTGVDVIWLINSIVDNVLYNQLSFKQTSLLSQLSDRQYIA
jgi:hypothetical protein